MDARLEREGGRWRCVGDPTEGALLVLAAPLAFLLAEELRKFVVRRL